MALSLKNIGKDKNGNLLNFFGYGLV